MTQDVAFILNLSLTKQEADDLQVWMREKLFSVGDVRYIVKRLLMDEIAK